MKKIINKKGIFTEKGKLLFPFDLFCNGGHGISFTFKKCKCCDNYKITKTKLIKI
jgi:hypothetical protein